MKKIVVLMLITLSFVSIVFAVDSNSADLVFSMNTENYEFGFANSLENAKNGTKETTFTIDGVTTTLYFFWKAMTPNKMKIELSSNGPLKTVVSPSDYQKIDYEIGVSETTEPGWWPEGASLSSNTTIKSSKPINVVSATLKGTGNYYYTQGICKLDFKMVDSSGNDIGTIEDLKKSKEGGSYSSTITLTVSNI